MREIARCGVATMPGVGGLALFLIVAQLVAGVVLMLVGF